MPSLHIKDDPFMSHRPFTLARAGGKDLPLLMTLIAEFCDVDQHPFESQRIEHALVPLLENDQYGEVWLVQPALGYVVITWGYSLESGGREALIDEIYLRQRGEGLGSAVLEQLLPQLAERDVRCVFLETERHNAQARRFYHRLGFAEDDSIWMSRRLTLSGVNTVDL